MNFKTQRSEKIPIQLLLPFELFMQHSINFIVNFTLCFKNKNLANDHPPFASQDNQL